MTVQVGIVGWGEIAQEHAKHLVTAGAKVAGVVSRRPYLALGIPVYPSLDQMLAHVDAVTVAVPNHLHAPACLQAVGAGVPVMVEKPLLITSEQLKQLESALINTSVPVHLGYRLRHNQSMVKLRERLRNVRRIRCIYELDIDELAENKEWTYQYSSTGGSFFTLGIHALDLARWLVGCRGERFSDLSATADSTSPSTDYPLRVSLSGLLPNGIHIEAGADLRPNLSSAIDLKVEAEKGAYPDAALPPPRLEDEPDEYRALIGDFIRAVRTGDIAPKEMEEVLQCHRELLAAREQSDVSS